MNRIDAIKGLALLLWGASTREQKEAREISMEFGPCFTIALDIKCLKVSGDGRVAEIQIAEFMDALGATPAARGEKP